VFGVCMALLVVWFGFWFRDQIAELFERERSYGEMITAASVFFFWLSL
jgi:Na+-driven multidrug efflux pump